MPLSKADKCVFVHDLIESVKFTITDAIKDGRVPEEWDGHELRRYIADKFTEQVFHAMMDRKRKREYRNTVIVNNL